MKWSSVALVIFTVLALPAPALLNAALVRAIEPIAKKFEGKAQ